MSLITPYLYLGSFKEAQDLNFLQGHRVSLVVNCAQELPNVFPNNFEYIRLDLNDHPSQSLGHVLDPIADEINRAQRAGRVVFVHCAAGISRSSSIVIYTLMKLHGWNFERSLKFVRDLHYRTDPNPGFVQQLVQRNSQSQRHGIPMSVNPSFDLIQPQAHAQPQAQPRYEEPECVGSECTVDAPYGSAQPSRWNLTLEEGGTDSSRPQYTPVGRGSYARIFG